MPLDLGVNYIQRMLDCLAYKQAIKNSQATQEQVDQLVKEAKSGWWERNKDRFPRLADG
ncbi:hypothetical protein [Haliscomenobacter hydrossis]|uniref:hypothetical protein n=1 Tax=Haliscomenobacter hydrossis TaxID=2350 RepID=UPI00030F5518|nr:hypothetical protein [Haliscomenobacter hydrossis]